MSDTALEVTRLAIRCLDTLQERANGLLDFSVGSLTIIEEILAEASKFYAELPESQIQTIVQEVGCYILAVGQKQFGGNYFWHDERAQPILVTGEPEKHIAMMTWEKVHGRLSGDIGDNIPFFYDGFAERVATATVGTKAIYT
jgi:hypothetical protein